MTKIMSEDWKAKLAALGGIPEAEEEPGEAVPNEAEKPQQTEKLRIVIDKKGRKGKVATIIEGFTLPDEDVEAIASELKRKIGTGGSSRGGEILLQGEWKDRAAELLKGKGFKI